MAKKAAAASKKSEPVVKAKPAKAHERKVKPSETDRIEKGRRVVAAYLEQRDGMDPQMALDIAEGMSPDELHELMVEANTSTAEVTYQKHPELRPDSVSPGGDTVKGGVVNGELTGSVLGQEAAVEKEAERVDFFALEALVNDPDDVVQMINDCIAANNNKKDGEAEYKRLKALLVPKLKALGNPKVDFMGIGLSPYTGHHITLSEQKLLEKGVPPDVIKACKVDTPYDDINFTFPKVAK